MFAMLEKLSFGFLGKKDKKPEIYLFIGAELPHSFAKGWQKEELSKTALPDRVFALVLENEVKVLQVGKDFSLQAFCQKYLGFDFSGKHIVRQENFPREFYSGDRLCFLKLTEGAIHEAYFYTRK